MKKNKNTKYLCIIGIAVFSYIIGLLTIIIGLPLTCENTYLYTFDKIESAKFALLMCLLYLSILIYILVRPKENRVEEESSGAQRWFDGFIER